MATYSPSRFDEIEKTLGFWENNPHFVLKNATKEEFAAHVSAVSNATKELILLDQRRRELVKKRNDEFTAASKIKTRLRKQVIADDPDSPDVKELGLTPLSERRRPPRKPQN